MRGTRVREKFMPTISKEEKGNDSITSYNKKFDVDDYFIKIRLSYPLVSSALIKLASN